MIVEVNTIVDSETTSQLPQYLEEYVSDGSFQCRVKILINFVVGVAN
jgi:hypothetical protein